MSDFDSILKNIREKIHERQVQFEAGVPQQPKELEALLLTEEMIVFQKQNQENQVELAEILTEKIANRFNMYSQKMMLQGLILDTLLEFSKKP